MRTKVRSFVEANPNAVLITEAITAATGRDPADHAARKAAQESIANMSAHARKAVCKGHMTDEEIKALNVKGLREAARKFIGKPSPLAATASASATDAATGPTVAVATAEPVIAAEPVTTPTEECSVQECDAEDPSDVLICGECGLCFCRQLHGPHESHKMQFIRQGKRQIASQDCRSERLGNDTQAGVDAATQKPAKVAKTHNARSGTRRAKQAVTTVPTQDGGDTPDIPNPHADDDAQTI